MPGVQACAVLAAAVVVSLARVMAAVETARARGAAVWPQVQTRPIDISFTLDQRSLMLLTMPSWWKVASIRDHADKARIRMNCSGKHALMLRACVATGWPTGGVLSAEMLAKLGYIFAAA